MELGGACQRKLSCLAANNLIGPASPPQTLPQPLPAPLNRRNLRFGYKDDVFCPEGCKPKED